jgi:hypothetical protein
MHTFNGDETVRVKAWLFIQAGQRLFVYVTGQTSEPSGEFTWLAYDHVVIEAQAQDGICLTSRFPETGWRQCSTDQDCSPIAGLT